MDDLHQELSRFSARRLRPGLPDDPRDADETRLRALEAAFLEGAREAVTAAAAEAPRSPEGFVAWYEGLRETGPGQHDPLFPWLAERATLAQMRWFLQQEVAGEAGFDDLVAPKQHEASCQSNHRVAV